MTSNICIFLILTLCGIAYGNSSQWSYNINDGQCKGTKLLSEDVYKEAEPFTTKKTAYTWRSGNSYTISCIKVHNQMPYDQNAGETRIVQGGVYQHDVKIEMTSKNSKHLHFLLEIWGEEIAQPASHSSVRYVSANNNRLTDRVMYVGEDRYCLC